MSASMLVNLCGRFCSFNFCKNCKIVFRKCASGKPKTFLYTSLLTVFAANKSEDERGKLEPPDPSTLTHSYLIRNAASQTVDNVSVLITQTALAIIETEGVFRDSANLLSELLEYKLTLAGNEMEENRVWDTILAVRAKLNAAKLKRQELSMLMSSVEKLVHDAGEVAFIAGAEYSATCSAERLQSAQVQINMARESSASAERKLQYMEIAVMEASNKQEQDAKQKQDTSKEEDSREERDTREEGDTRQGDVRQETRQGDSKEEENLAEKVSKFDDVEDLEPVISFSDNPAHFDDDLFTSSVDDESETSHKKGNDIFASSKYYDFTHTDEQPVTNFYASDGDSENLHF